MPLTRSSLYMVLLTIVSVLIFSAISTYVSPGSSLFWLISILYIVVFMSLSMLIPRLAAKRKAVEIKGSIILKASPQEVIDLASKDIELGKELSRQALMPGLMAAISLIVWFFFAGIIQSYLLRALIGSDVHYMRFLGYIIFYVILIGIVRALMYFVTPKKMLMLVNSYEIRSDGIRAGGLIIKFPIDEKRYSVEFNTRRGYFEIYDKASRYAYRFYTSDVDKVKTALGKYGKAK